MPPELSTVPEVRADLVTRFRGYLAAENITDVQVTYGEPGGELPARLIAVCGLVNTAVSHDARRTPRADSKVDEEYSLAIVIWHQAQGRADTEAQQAVYEGCWDLARLLARKLRASHDEQTLDGLVTYARFTRFTDGEWLTDDPSRSAEVIAQLTVTAVHI